MWYDKKTRYESGEYMRTGKIKKLAEKRLHEGSSGNPRSRIGRFLYFFKNPLLSAMLTAIITAILTSGMSLYVWEYKEETKNKQIQSEAIFTLCESIITNAEHYLRWCNKARAGILATTAIKMKYTSMQELKDKVEFITKSNTELGGKDNQKNESDKLTINTISNDLYEKTAQIFSKLSKKRKEGNSKNAVIPMVIRSQIRSCKNEELTVLEKLSGFKPLPSATNEETYQLLDCDVFRLAILIAEFRTFFEEIKRLGSFLLILNLDEEYSATFLFLSKEYSKVFEEVKIIIKKQKIKYPLNNKCLEERLYWWVYYSELTTSK